jgi:acetyltransferase-like isoleucine patch superfamily enzyme
MGRAGRVVGDLIGAVVLWIPGGVGSRLRIAYYAARGARIGRGARLDVGVSIDQPHFVTIGSESWIDRFAILIAGEPRPGRETRLVGSSSDGNPSRGHIEIGERCHIGPYVVLSGLGGLRLGDDVTLSTGAAVYSLSHHYRSWSRPDDRAVVFGSQGPAALQSMLEGPVILEPNVGVGAGSLLLPGTHIGRDSFVRPHAVVSGSWPENSLLAGDPAARTGDRYEPDRIGSRVTVQP